MYSILVSSSSEYKNRKTANKNVAAKVSHNEYKDVLLNKNCLTYSMNKIQSQSNRLGTYEINKISLSCFDDKIFHSC